MLAISTRALRNSHLRLLFQRSFWEETWRSIKRAHKDRRARKHVLLLVGFGGVFLTLSIGIAAFAAALVDLIWVLALIFALVVFTWWLRRSATIDSRPVPIDPPTDPALSFIDPEQQTAVREYFQQLTFLYAVLVERAGSERYLKEREVPDGTEITARRMHIELLRGVGVWEQLASADREILMMPDGSWSPELISRISIGLEPLRLLRWLLRIDFWLPSIGQNLYGTYDCAHELVSHPNKVLHNTQLADPMLIRMARDDAALFRLRCRAEEISRRYIEPQSTEVAEWADEIVQQLKGNQDEDLLLLEKLVSEADEKELSWAWALATMRVEFFDHALAIIERGTPPLPPVASVFAQSNDAAARVEGD